MNTKQIAGLLRSLAEYVERDDVRINESTNIMMNNDTVAMDVNFETHYYSTGTQNIVIDLHLQNISIKASEHRRHMNDLNNS